MCKAKSFIWEKMNVQYTAVKDANHYKFHFLLGPQMVVVYPLKVIKIIIMTWFIQSSQIITKDKFYVN